MLRLTPSRRIPLSISLVALATASSAGMAPVLAAAPGQPAAQTHVSRSGSTAPRIAGAQTRPAQGKAAAPAAPAPQAGPAVPAPVEKGELSPVMAQDGSGLPYEMWRGLDVGAVETLISTLEIPPRSPALHDVWKRLITAGVTAPSGAAADSKFAALRLEALYRSGLAREAAAEIAKSPPGNDPLLMILAARNELAAGNAKQACDLAPKAAAAKGNVPARLRGQAILMTGYCAAAANDSAAAGLSAELAREAGLETSPGLEALDALPLNAKPKFTIPKQITLLDYRLAERLGGLPHKDVLEKGEPALLAALSSDASTPVDLGLPASEAAARLNAMTPETLAGIYRANAGNETADALLAGSGGPQGALRRAALFKAAEVERTPMKKTRLIRAFLDEAKRQNLLMQALQMVAPAAAQINPQPETSWFAETGAEIGVAAAQYDMARHWIALADGPDGAGRLKHWLTLVDIADANDPKHGQSLVAMESPAINGRFSPDTLHRLVTVLDALSYQIPIPLWDVASRTPQPSTGYLPETGVLSQLQDASNKKEFGRTVLLAMKALGPNGAEGAHMISLGDSIRALRRAGLEKDARRLGLEALLGAWPRTATN